MVQKICTLCRRVGDFGFFLLQLFAFLISTSNMMLHLLLGLAALGLAQEEFKALNARANYSEPLDSLLPRELTGRQQSCDAGYGLCGKLDQVTLSTMT